MAVGSSFCKSAGYVLCAVMLIAFSSGEFHYQRLPVPELWLVGRELSIEELEW